MLLAFIRLRLWGFYVSSLSPPSAQDLLEENPPSPLVHIQCIDTHGACSHRVLLYGGDMKVWMVLALLAMGLGCSQPEPWSHPTRVSFVDTCTAAGQPEASYNTHWEPDQKIALKRLREGGYTVREICRIFLQKTEAKYTESDFFLLSDLKRLRWINNISHDVRGELQHPYVEIPIEKIWDMSWSGSPAYYAWAENLGDSSSG